MSTADILKHLSKLTPAERLEIAETAMRLNRENSESSTGQKDCDDPVLKVSGCLSGLPISATEIETQLYGE